MADTVDATAEMAVEEAENLRSESEIPQEIQSPSAISSGQADTSAARAAGRASDATEDTYRDNSKKKPRLQWDEENLTSNALEMEKAAPRMKIDEPKTPFVASSENGSSTSGSTPQSPGSPSFMPHDHLVGFKSLEDDMKVRHNRAPTSSDGASSAGSTGQRSVHIADVPGMSSGGSSPRAKEQFAAKRKLHYKNEARLGQSFVGIEDDTPDEQAARQEAEAKSEEAEHVNGANGVNDDDESGTGNSAE